MRFKYFAVLTTLLSLSVNAIEIYPQVSSTIVEIKPVNTQVKPGDIVVKLDDQQAQLELEYLQVMQSIKQQTFDDKQLQLLQTQELYERMVSSDRDVEIATLEFNAAKRELDAHNLKIKIAKLELDKFQIKSPISGVVKSLPNPRNTTNINSPRVLMIIE